MRINKFIAQATGLSRRAADAAITDGHVSVNNQPATAGQEVSDSDVVTLNGTQLQTTTRKFQTILLNKPVGYVCSREGQGSKTIYELLPSDLHYLKPVGRLDKDSSGLLLLTNDGTLAHELTHPSFQKEKVYLVELNKPLTPSDKAKVGQGVQLEDGLSMFTVIPTVVEGSRKISRQARDDNLTYKVRMSEGRNRQIRRTFAALGYKVVKLHRTSFGKYALGDLRPGEFTTASS